MTTFVPLSKKEDVLPLQARNNLARIRYLSMLEEEEKKESKEIDKDCVKLNDEVEKYTDHGKLSSIKRQKLGLAISTYSLLENEVHSLERGIAELQSLLDADGDVSSDDEDFEIASKSQIQGKMRADESDEPVLWKKDSSSTPSHLNSIGSNPIEDEISYK